METIGARALGPAGLALAALVALAAAPAALAQGPAPDPRHDVRSYGLVYQAAGADDVVVRAGVPFKTAGGAPLALDLYLPKGAAKGSAYPVVVFVNGVGDRPGDKLKDWGQYRSWPRLMAASGFAAVAYEARPEHAAEELRDVVAYLTANAADLGVDPARVGLWACSANVLVALPYLMSEAGPAVRCAALYYGVGEAERLRADLPVLFVRAGRDRKELNERVDRLLARVASGNLPWTVLNAANSHHAFDRLDETEESRRAIRQTVAYFEDHLAAPPAAPEPSLARLALAHWFAQEWEPAAEAYARVVAADPGDAVAANRLGVALLQTRRYPEAIAALEGAARHGAGGAATHYNLACAYALAGDRGRAIESLERAVAAGYRDKRHMLEDADLASVRDDPRFRALVERMN